MTMIPEATLHRYPLYLKALRRLKLQGKERISSKDLSELTDVEATTIRRDFSFFGSLGKHGVGYEIDSLIEHFEKELGVQFDEKIILVGAGNLGKALLHYNRWSHVVGEIVCGFDVDPKVIDPEADFPIYPVTELKEHIPKGCRLAIITGDLFLQQTIDNLVECGIIGIIDFTNEHFTVPKSVTVKNIDVVSTIQELVFAINFNNNTRNEDPVCENG